MTRALWVAAALGVAAFPGAAAGEPWLARTLRMPASVTATLAAGVHTDGDGYGEVFGRVNGSVTSGPWHLGLRLDTATFVSPPAGGIFDRYSLEKVSLGWAGRAVEVTAGDFYVSFGRGLGLSVRKIDELGVDTTLRGATVAARRGAVDATVAAGYGNINNVDEATGTSVDDPYDLVAGAKVQVRLADRVNVGAYGSAVAFRGALGLVPNDAYTDRFAQYGVIVDAPRLTERVGFYCEGMGQVVSTEPARDESSGFGLYATGTAYLGKFSLLVEGKAYGALTPVAPNLGAPAFATVAYNSPPTVERVLQVIENPQRNIAGARARLDWSISPAWLAYVNYGLFKDWEGYADPATLELRPGVIHDPYAGLEARWDSARSWAIVSGGWRVVILDQVGTLVRGDGHLELDVAQAVGERWSVTLHATHQERKKHESPLLDEAFREGSVSLGVRLRPWVTVAGGYDYTTEPAQPKRDYFHGDIGWDITPSSSVQLFVGSARGGLRCVSGVCRVLPSFAGVKLTAVLRF